MKAFAIIAIFAFVSLAEYGSASKGPLRLCTRAWCKDELLDANTESKARGTFTDTHGSSDVEVNPLGSSASVSHKATGQGVGLTGSRSSGRIDSNSLFGSSTLGSKAEADAFGSHNSFSHSEGGAKSFDGLGAARASSKSGGSGYGSSSARSSAAAGQVLRQKRSTDVNAGTDEGALGDFTKTFGDSEVHIGANDVAFGEAHFGAKGQGKGRTGAKSQGDVEASDLFGHVATGSAASADAFGDWKSYSESKGDAELAGGWTSAGAASKAGSLGSVKSSSRTRASASSRRQKRCAVYRKLGGANRRSRLCDGGGSSSVDAKTEAKAIGDFTDTFGRSSVDVDNFGTRANLEHGARGRGIGYTAAKSGGKIYENGLYRGTVTGSEGTAEAFGNLGSFSETRGNAQSYNGYSSSGSSATAGSQGYGSSSSRTSASGGSFRHKRSVDVSAGTDEGALGDFTETFGDSQVHIGPNDVAFGEAHYAAKGLGLGITGAKSDGGVDASDLDSHVAAESAARADAFGNWNSYSETKGDVELVDDWTAAGAASRAGSVGSQKSSSRTRASASSTRQKRHVNFPRPCRLPRCGGPIGQTMNAETDAAATGHLTDTFGHSNVQTDNFGTRGSVLHRASGRGIGHTSARSGGRIITKGPYGGSQVGSQASGSAYGNMGSFSETQGSANSYNGYGSSGSSATAGGHGYGASSSRTSASAGAIRYKRNAGKRLCIMGVCYEAVDTRTGGTARGDFTESFGDSSISVQPGSLDAMAVHESIGRGRGIRGTSSKAIIDSRTQFGSERIGSAGKAEAFGDRSVSWTKSKTRKVNGFSMSGTDSKASSSGRGRSAARSEAVATRCRTGKRC